MINNFDEELENLILEMPEIKFLNDFHLLKEENNKLKDIILHFLGWSDGRHCNDCTPFREAPSCISYIHHKECAYLEVINKALAILGMPPEEGHDRIDPEGDMIRMAEERYQDCVKKGLMK